MGYVKHTLIIFINFALIYALIDKRKPITGMGCPATIILFFVFSNTDRFVFHKLYNTFTSFEVN